MTDNRKFAGYLAFTIWVAAAIYDGTPEQRQRLQDEVRPMLKDLRDDKITIEPILDTVTDIMGEEWAPKNEWKAWIDKLVK